MQYYAITYGLLARQLDLTPGPGNQRHAALEFAAMAYDREGTLLQGIRSKIGDTLRERSMGRDCSFSYAEANRPCSPTRTAPTIAALFHRRLNLPRYHARAQNLTIYLP
ncbi:MAG: hypothetical protein M3O31_08825 [Acidobacteriota bacterium]|nr:hypothetical protein [Acidobacteriota bacterium]